MKFNVTFTSLIVTTYFFETLFVQIVYLVRCCLHWYQSAKISHNNHYTLHHNIIIESVDSISRDGPDTPIYIIHYKKRNNSEQENFKRF